MDVETYKIKLYKELVKKGYDVYINRNLGEEFEEQYPVIDIIITDNNNAYIVDILRVSKNSQSYVLYKLYKQRQYIDIGKRLLSKEYENVHAVILLPEYKIPYRLKIQVVAESLKYDIRYKKFGISDIVYNAFIDTDKLLLNVIHTLTKYDNNILVIQAELYSDMYEHLLTLYKQLGTKIEILNLLDDKNSINKDTLRRIFENNGNKVSLIDIDYIARQLENLYQIGFITDHIELASIVSRIADAPIEKTRLIFQVLQEFIKNNNHDNKVLLRAVNDIIELIRYTKNVMITKETLKEELKTIISTYSSQSLTWKIF